MDCKCESAAITGARIGVLVAEGMIRTALCTILGVVLTPFVPFYIAILRWRVSKGIYPFLARLIVFPLWFMAGIVIAVLQPFVIIWNQTAMTIRIAKVEWANRWMSGSPKSPRGEAIEPRSAEFNDALESAVHKSVLRDYAKEAAEHGQPIIPGGNGDE